MLQGGWRHCALPPSASPSAGGASAAAGGSSVAGAVAAGLAPAAAGFAPVAAGFTVGARGAAGRATFPGPALRPLAALREAGAPGTVAPLGPVALVPGTVPGPAVDGCAGTVDGAAPATGGADVVPPGDDAAGTPAPAPA